VPALVEPTVAVHESFLRAMDDFAAEGRGGPDDTDSALGRNIIAFGAGWRTVAGFAAFLESLQTEGDVSVAPPDGWVHSSTYWYLDGPTFLGCIRIRHRLTPHLLEVGGHVGYDVAPAARLNGYGTAMLRDALPIAADLGLDRLLITCDSDNLGSRRIIESNGGVFSDERKGMLRFWVPTS
jgi:predicted acetyltransferase